MVPAEQAERVQPGFPQQPTLMSMPPCLIPAREVLELSKALYFTFLFLRNPHQKHFGTSSLINYLLNTTVEAHAPPPPLPYILPTSS